MHYVIGSGPSGVAAAYALLLRGLPVTMLDIGDECEPERLAIAQQLARLEPEIWDPALVARLRGPSPDPQQPRKLCYGSGFCYAPDALMGIEQQGTHCLHSTAKGGLSNVWGASVLPARAEDFRNWPVQAGAMAPHYAATARLLGIAGEHDPLESHYPYYSPPSTPLAPSRQAQLLLARLQTRQDRLARAGIVFGQSRLAVRTTDEGQDKRCRHTGLCLTGCPYSAIWNSASLLPMLAARGDFAYHGGVRVTAVEPRSGAIRIRGVSVKSGASQVWEGKKVFIACGPLSTSSIILRSLGVTEGTLRMQYQPYFLLPLLALHGVRDAADERLHTLTQIYLELADERISASPVHLQLYTYNHFIRERLERLRFLPRSLGAGIRRLAEGRLLVMQGYLGSDEAEGIELHARNPSGSFRLRAGADNGVAGKIRRTVSVLTRRFRDIGALPLRPLLRIGLPGEGNHIGGVFPMRSAPGRQETDVLGRLPTLPGVHLVDASVLPNLPAASYTYTIMANAHRIASEVADGVTV